ncbi:MAG: MFS transporter [Actinomycetota bacterium]
MLNRRKYLITASSFLIMLCLGGFYGFSIFVPPLRQEYGFSTAQTQLILSLIILSFTISFAVAGKLLVRLGPRVSCIICALLFFSGYMLASYSGGRLGWLVVGIGLLAGTATGFGYVSCLTTPVQWFPKKRGTITGIAVAGFGAGAILLSFLVSYLLSRGFQLPFIFRAVAVVYGTVILLSSLVLALPRKIRESGVELVGIRLLLRDKKFWLLFWLMFMGTFSGILIIGNLKPIGLFYGADNFYSTLAISMLSIGNFSGRIFWGRLTDVIGTEKSIIYAQLSLAVSVFLLIFLGGDNIGLALLAFFVGTGFGSNFVLFASEVCHHYGIKNLGGVYPFVHLSYGISGIIAPIAGGFFFDVWNTYLYSVAIASCFALAGSIATWVSMRFFFK